MKNQILPTDLASNDTIYKCNCTVIVEYGDTINCIDFEQLLKSIRKITMYELAEISNSQLNPAKFRNAIRIRSIEKGCIIINLILDIAPSLFAVLSDVSNIAHNDSSDCLDWVRLLVDALCLNKEYQHNKDKVLKCVKKFSSILSKVKFIDLQNNKHKVRVTTNNNGGIKIVELNKKHKHTNF